MSADWRSVRGGGTVALVTTAPDATVEEAVGTLVRQYFGASPWGNDARNSLAIGGAGYAHECEALWRARVHGALAAFVFAVLGRSYTHDSAVRNLRASLRGALIHEFGRRRP